MEIFHRAHGVRGQVRRGHIDVHAPPPDPGDAEALPDGELAVDDEPTPDRVRLIPMSELLDYDELFSRYTVVSYVVHLGYELMTALNRFWICSGGPQSTLLPESLDRVATEDDEARALDGEGEAAAAAVHRAERRYVGEAGALDDVVLVAVPHLDKEDCTKACADHKEG